MLDYEYSSVTIERIRDADTDEDRIYASLHLEPINEKIFLTYKSSELGNRTISFEFYIEDWKDAFQRIVDEKIHANRNGGIFDPTYPKDLKITGNRNPLVNMIALAFCCPQSAELCLRLIDCSQKEIEDLLISNNNFETRSSVKFAKILCTLLDEAFLRVKHIINFDCIRLSNIMKTARKKIALNEKKSLQMQRLIEAGSNNVVLAQGPFLVVEILNQEAFENIYEPCQYALVYLEDIDDFGSEKIPACAVGNKNAKNYIFSLTFSHLDSMFSSETISAIPHVAFSVIESYFDMIS